MVFKIKCLIFLGVYGMDNMIYNVLIIYEIKI